LGSLLIVANEQKLLGVWMDRQKHFGRGITFNDLTNKTNTITHKTQIWIKAYFAGQNPDLKTLPLAPAGTTFQQQVWQILTQIPYGQTWTYRQIAQKLGKYQYSQAVGQAVGHNPIAIIIPCHRVISSQGRLTGYAGGLERKKWLLDHEQKTKLILSISNN
ncbi:methylated-DNA--[protein]-cysteine S-methyltransferase, partial [Lactobacillus sp. XV13L]|nr:methylated-DNA--[protein]-cysteine S-methyltransferase [Lactobacillus sp. XV13L]